MQTNILLYTDNLLTYTAANGGLVENYCITLLQLLRGSDFHFFNAYNRNSYQTDNEHKNNFYFNPTECFHVRKDSTVEELALFISNVFSSSELHIFLLFAKNETSFTQRENFIVEKIADAEFKP